MSTERENALAALREWSVPGRRADLVAAAWNAGATVVAIAEAARVGSRHTIYDDLKSRDLVDGPVFRGLDAAWDRNGETFAEAALPDGGRADATAFGLHPALLDAALHALVVGNALPAARDGAPWMPFAWSGLRLHATGALRVRVRITAAADDGTVRLDLADSAGNAVLTAAGLTLRQLPAGRLTGPPAHTDHLYHQAWLPLSRDLLAPPPDAPGQDWTVWGANRHHLAVATAPPEASPGAVIWHAPGGSGAPGARAAAVQALETVRRWLADDACAEARLVVVTTAGVAVAPGERTDEGAAAVWGMVRSAQSEHPGRITLLDLAEGTAPAAADLAALLAADEPQLAWRRDGAHVPRLVRTARSALLPVPPSALGPSDGTRPALRVGMRSAGSADRLEWLSADRPDELPAGHIRVAVRAAGLNFRDVVAGLGMAGGDAGLLGTAASSWTSAPPSPTSPRATAWPGSASAPSARRWSATGAAGSGCPRTGRSPRRRPSRWSS